MARMTLWGMTKYDPSLLDGIRLPEGMDVGLFKELLMEACGDLYPYYQVPPRLKSLIAAWFTARQTDIERMYASLSAEYNPIENYDRTEEHKDVLQHSGTDTDTNTLGTKEILKRTGTEDVTGHGEDVTIQQGTQKTEEQGTEKTVGSGQDTQTVSVSAYDAATYQPREQTVNAPGSTQTRTPNLITTVTPDLTTIVTPESGTTRTPDLTDETSRSGSDSLQKEWGHKEDRTLNIRAHGNIGVTTNQEMILSELSLRQKNNLYYIVIGMFEDRFMSQVY